GVQPCALPICFGRFAEAEMALANERVTFQTPCWFRLERRAGGDLAEAETRPGRWIRTTVGRVIFNSVVPEELGFWNMTMGKKELGEVIFQAYRRVGLR